MAYDRTRTARRILLARATSALALATGLAIGGTGTAHAQAFEGNPVVVSGGVGINRTPGTDNIRVDTDQAVINWTTNDTGVGGGPINFLPSGRTAFFRNNPTLQNQFTVLNRIIPTDPNRAIALNGSIISQLQTGAGLVSGGNVWFYSPGGIVVGATAVIDVGGLVMTSLDPVRDGAGNFINAGGSFTLSPAASATSYIQVDPGAQVRLTPQNSYVAMVAPIIRQNGSVNVNGSAAYVAAEAATLTINNGLFDIQVTTGTNGDAAAQTNGVNTAINHGGTTGGPASSGAGDNHRIYMVAVPKNNAVTLLVNSGSNLGFDIAGAADVVGNSIILSAGFNVFGDNDFGQTPVNPAQAANIVVTNSTVTSAFRAAASQSFLAQATGGGLLGFASNFTANALNSAQMSSSGVGSLLSVNGSLNLSSNVVTNALGQSAVGGTARVQAFASGRILVGGSATVQANGQSLGGGDGTGGLVLVQSSNGGLIDMLTGLTINTDGIGVNGTGGLTQLLVNAGNATTNITGNVTATANGIGSTNASGIGGAGLGGRVTINGDGGTGNALNLNGNVFASASAVGGASTNDGAAGGAGTGGQVFLNVGTGTIVTVAGSAELVAEGVGGGAGNNGVGGIGTGGLTNSGIFGDNGRLIFQGTYTSSANGFGGDGFGDLSVGGIGRGGNASVNASRIGSIELRGVTTIAANGTGGAGGTGGNGFGGAAFLAATSPAVGVPGGTLIASNAVTIRADGLGGVVQEGVTSGRTGNGTGGDARITAQRLGSVQITGDVNISSNGSILPPFSARTGDDGGDGTGGTASISQSNGGTITITGNAFVSATGTGDSNSGGGDGIAGNGVGGDVRIAVNDSIISITGNATTDARGFGGANVGGIRGGNGTGGLANLGAGAGTLSIGGIGTTNADGRGGSSTGNGSGGNGTGGRAIIGSIAGGIIGITGAANATAQGFAGDASGTGTTGGVGQGGIAQLFAETNGSLTAGGLTTLNASGFGGSAGAGGSSGNATGGTASLLTNGNGQMTLNQNTLLSAQGLSGNVTSGGGNVGTATGGTANMLASGAGSVITVNGTLRADAVGQAGSALTGTIGAAQGGTVVLQAAEGTFNVAGAVSLDSSATGGNSTQTGNGGNATGGRSATVIAGAGGGRISLGNTLTMTSNGTGGSAQTGNGGAGTGGIGEIGTIGIIGNFAFGGNITMTANGTGGSALLAGNGGAGTGGQASLGSNSTQMTGRDLGIQANGRGGNGALGGAGGVATGGRSAMFAGNGTLTGLLDFDNINLFAEAFGGNGGAGATGTTGGAGGAGGNATGGTIVLTSAAGNGQLDLTNIRLIANGTGGAGGVGGVGTAGAGGIGGAGGNGTGGSNTFGTESATGAPTVNVGQTRLVDAISESSGFGGAGGNGGTGSTGLGNGGAGGVGTGGGSVLLVRGSRFTLNNATLVSDGLGGAGGTGAVRGVGGNGIGGGFAFAITDRFNIPAHRGQLVANNLQAGARGIGGAGSVAGQSLYGTGSNVEIRNADATIRSLVINKTGTAPNPVGIVPDFIRVTDGTLAVTTGFTYVNPGQLSVLVNNGAVNSAGFSVNAGTFVADSVITAPNNVGTITSGLINLQSAGNILVTANLATPSNLSAVATGAVTLRNINAGGVIGIQGASLQLGDLTSGNHINLTSTSGAITAGAVTAANFIAMTAANGLTLSTATATNGNINLLVNAGNMTIGNLTAGTLIELDTRAGNMVLGDIRSGAETEMEAVGTVQFGNAVTGLEFAITARGNITGGNVSASGAVPTTSYSVGLLSQTGSIQVGNLTGTRNIGFISAGTITAGSLTSGENIVVLGTGDIAFGGAVTTGSAANRYFYVGNASMVSSLGPDFDPTPLFALVPVRTAGGLTVNGILSSGQIRAGIGTAANVNGAMTATAGSIAITANSIAAQAMNAALGVNLTTTNGALGTGAITATAGNILLTSSGAITTGALATGTGANLAISVDGGGAVSIGGVTATGAAQLRSRSASFSSTGPITAALVNIGGTAVTLANVTSTVGDISLAANAGNLSFGALNAANSALFSATGSATGGDITAAGAIGTQVGGNMTVGNLRTTGAGTTSLGLNIGLAANGTITTGTINSFGALGVGSNDGQGNFGNAASITTGAITAGGTVLLRANQSIVTGNVGSTNEIRLRAGSVATGALQATNAVFAAATNGSLTTGNVTTGTNALLLASQNISTGGISTGATGTALLASSAGVSPTANLSQTDLNALLASTPQRVGGSISIGATTTGTLLAASTGTFSANSTITAGTRISLDVGGTAVFGGLAVAPTIAISSGDIAFSQGGGLGNASTGTITLTANRSGSVVIGGTTSDSQSSGTYSLDGSEIARIRAQNIVINAPNVSSSGTGVEIRALTMNGSSASSGVNLNGAEGGLTINTPGTIRVNGNAVFNSMAATNRVSLNAGRVEINADSGGIFLNGSSPGGILSINANNIHIASAELLGRLAENVNFTGRDTALGLPIATARPDGVIQASSLRFTVGSTLLIQNTGTSLLNAGFFGRVGSFQVSPRSSQSQSSSQLIDLVIYGQLLDTGDLVRNGSSVRDLIFPRSISSTGQDSGGPSGFTSTSSVNGCLLSAISCGGGGISEQSPTVISHAGPPPPRPAAEREAQKEQEEAEAAAEEAARGAPPPRKPIMPPVTIVNTRRLGVEPIIDEPVTSGGNPNLQLDQPLPDTGGQP